MHICHIRVYSVAVSRVYHTHVAPTGGHSKNASRYYVLELETNTGLRGLGEISDLEEAWQAPSPEALRETLTPLLAGADPRKRLLAWERVAEALPASDHPEFRRLVSAAVEMALIDLAGKYYNAPAYALLGGQYRDALPISWVAYIRSADELAEEIQEKVATGFTAFKLKVGADFELDCERVRVCRRLVGPDAYLKADASGAWEEQEAIERIRELSALGVDAVETPIQCVARKVAKDHPEQVNADPDSAALALARVRAAVPAALIEHVADFDDSFALALLRHRAVDAFNVAPVQAGSLHRAQRLSQLAAAAGVPVLLGSTVELGIGTAAAVHLGVATKAVCAPSDLVGPGLLASDVVTPRLAYQQGCLHAPPGPGLGVELIPELMEQKGTP